MRHALAALLVLIVAGGAAAGEPPAEKPAEPPVTLERICTLIGEHAERQGLPLAYFARLLWTESRFDPDAVSPAGAEGIAQFMPGTAKMRGLADSFDIEQAIPASAAYLKDLRRRFGNLGLAAAAYNSGERRVTRWLSAGGFLPMETEGYVLGIMGEPVENFAAPDHVGVVYPLEGGTPFQKACRRLPVTRVATIAMASVNVKPWGVQVAGNFSRAAAIGRYERLRKRLPEVFADHEPVVSRVRSAMGRRGIHVVRIGADDRADADIICRKLRGAGGSCVVLRNR